MTKHLNFEVLPWTHEAGSGIRVHPAQLKAIITHGDAKRLEAPPIEAWSVWMNDRIIRLFLRKIDADSFAKELDKYHSLIEGRPLPKLAPVTSSPSGLLTQGNSAPPEASAVSSETGWTAPLIQQQQLELGDYPTLPGFVISFGPDLYVGGGQEQRFDTADEAAAGAVAIQKLIEAQPLEPAEPAPETLRQVRPLV